MISLKKEITKYEQRKKEILVLLEAGKVNEQDISMFCVTASFPVYVVYYFLYKETDNSYYKSRCKDLCKFYKIEEEL